MAPYFPIFAGGGVSWYPTNIVGSVIGYDAALGITMDGSNRVSQWDDISAAAANHLTQATDAKKLVWTAARVNGLPTLIADGADDCMLTAAFTWNQPECIYLVMNMISFTDVDYILDGVAIYKMVFYQNAPSPGMALYTDTFYVSGCRNTDLAVGSFGIVRVVFNGASSEIRVNNNVATTGDPGTGSAGGFTLAAAGLAGGVNSQWINAEYAMIWGYNVVPTTAEDTAMMTYLNTKFAIY